MSASFPPAQNANGLSRSLHSTPALPPGKQEALSSSPVGSDASVTHAEKDAPSFSGLPGPKHPVLVHRRDSDLFINATIPLSPVASMTSDDSAPIAMEQRCTPEAPKARGLRRLFRSCFGDRRRRAAYVELVPDGHWTEL